MLGHRRQLVRLLTGAGTGMNPLAMTSWEMAIGAPDAMSRAVATPIQWTISYAIMMFMMWWGMMIAMMLPSAAPVILLYAKISGEGALSTDTMQASLRPAAFVAGYLLAWVGSVVWQSHSSGSLNPWNYCRQL